LIADPRDQAWLRKLLSKSQALYLSVCAGDGYLFLNIHAQHHTRRVPVTMLTRSRLATLFATTGVIACVQSEASNQPSDIAFVESERYGWAELSDSTRPMSEAERRYRGAVLSNVAGIAEAEDGTLLVLDRDFQKIVLFEANADLKGLILGGYGEGPGEFTFPRHLSIDAEGRIVVLDRGNRRVTVFDSAGTYLSSDQVGFEALQAVVAGDTTYLLDVPRDGRSALRARKAGDPSSSLESVLPADSRMSHFAEHGEPGALGGTPSGHILYAHPSPGRWYDGVTSQWRGRELYPKVEGERLLEADGFERRYISVGSRAIGVLPTGETLIVYANLARPGSGAPDTTRALLFDEQGRLSASGVLSDSSRVRHIVASSRERAVYAAYTEPYPHIRKLVIVSQSLVTNR
jgi:hypothetical protein